MSTYAVTPIGNDRFAIWVVGSDGRAEEGPYGGDDHKGLTEVETRTYLKEHGWLDTETQDRIDAANARRAGTL